MAIFQNLEVPSIVTLYNHIYMNFIILVIYISEVIVSPFMSILRILITSLKPKKITYYFKKQGRKLFIASLI